MDIERSLVNQEEEETSFQADDFSLKQRLSFSGRCIPKHKTKKRGHRFSADFKKTT